jgi:hypothetical protein
MHTIYDLKGSTVGRYKKEGETVRYIFNGYTFNSYYVNVTRCRSAVMLIAALHVDVIILVAAV